MPFRIKNDPSINLLDNPVLRNGLVGNRVITALIEQLRAGTMTHISLTGKISMEGVDQEMQYFLRPPDIQRLFDFLHQNELIANKIKHIEMSNCNIGQSEAFNELPLLPNLTTLSLKNNLLSAVDFSFAPNLINLDLSHNFFEELNLNTSTKLKKLIVGSNLKALMPPHIADLILETPAIHNLDRNFAQWIEEREADPSLNIYPKITFRQALPSGSHDYSGSGDETGSSADEEEDDDQDYDSEHHNKKARPTRRSSS